MPFSIKLTYEIVKQYDLGTSGRSLNVCNIKQNFILILTFDIAVMLWLNQKTYTGGLNAKKELIV